MKAWKPEKNKRYELATVGNATVKLYRRERKTLAGEARWIFEVSDYTAGPRRLRGFSDLAEARREAMRIAGQLATGEANAAAMLGTEAASYGRAVELLRPTGASLELATATYAKAFEILGGDYFIEAARFFSMHRVDKLVRRTVAEVASELVEAKKSRGKSGAYVRTLANQLAHFAESFAVDISAVTGPDIQNWLDRQKVKPRTAKNIRGTLYTAFAFAEARGYILRGSNPVALVERITTQADGAVEIYTPEEIAALLQAASKEFLPIVAIGAFAGVRAAEIERLDWRDIDLAGGFIHVASEKAKTRSRRLVPILPNLAQWLAPYAGRGGKVWKLGTGDMQEARTAVAKAAGVAWKPNGLRHSFISYRTADIQNVAQVALEAGNTPNVVFRNYREVVKASDAKTWFSIAPEQPANVLPMAAEVAK